MLHIATRRHSASRCGQMRLRLQASKRESCPASLRARGDTGILCLPAMSQGGRISFHQTRSQHCTLFHHRFSLLAAEDDLSLPGSTLHSFSSRRRCTFLQRKGASPCTSPMASVDLRTALSQACHGSPLSSLHSPHSASPNRSHDDHPQRMSERSQVSALPAARPRRRRQDITIWHSRCRTHPLNQRLAVKGTYPPGALPVLTAHSS